MKVRREVWILVALCAQATAAACQTGTTSIELGSHYGFRLSERGPEGTRVGVQASLQFDAPFEMGASVSVQPGFPGPDNLEGAAQHAMLSGGWYPLGRTLAVGYGLQLSRISIRVRSTGDRATSVYSTDLVYARLSPAGWRVRPFTQLVVLNALARTDRTTALLLFGLAVSIS